eukprot:152415-Rhodomonas_salina.3
MMPVMMLPFTLGVRQFIEPMTPLAGEKSNMPQQDRHEGQLAGGDSNRSSDLPPCQCGTLATTTGRRGYLEGFD